MELIHSVAVFIGYLWLFMAYISIMRFLVNFCRMWAFLRSIFNEDDKIITKVRKTLEMLLCFDELKVECKETGKILHFKKF